MKRDIDTLRRLCFLLEVPVKENDHSITFARRRYEYDENGDIIKVTELKGRFERSQDDYIG